MVDASKRQSLSSDPYKIRSRVIPSVDRDYSSLDIDGKIVTLSNLPCPDTDSQIRSTIVHLVHGFE
jgi:hypothetical protein